MSGAPARNWAAMLKEKKTAAPTAGEAKRTVTMPLADASKISESAPATAPAPAPAAEPAEPVKVEEVTLSAEPTAEHILSPVSVATPVAQFASSVTYTAMGPVSLPESLVKLVQSNDFRFAGAAASRTPALTPASTPAVAPAPQPVASQPAPVTPPAPIAAAPTVTSSSELRGHPQWTAPQPVYNPPVNYFVPQQTVARPYGGELGSVPRYYNAERHFNPEQQQHAQPYHPTYHTPYYSQRGGYGAAAYNPYDNMYPSYYPGQGAPYMGGRLQAQQPYYPPRNYQQQQQ